MSGLAISRHIYAEAFEEPVRGDGFAVKAVSADDAPLIASFFNAEDFAVRRSFQWYELAEFDADYVRDLLLPHLELIDEQRNALSLYIYDASETRALNLRLGRYAAINF